ncbi:MAG: hypothetical protein MZV64_42550 [Ignavibacteriales bacterium]|nr:hypothetical protein [Ignavibacteriales bacterium]
MTAPSSSATSVSSRNGAGAPARGGAARDHDSPRRDLQRHGGVDDPGGPGGRSARGCFRMPASCTRRARRRWCASFRRPTWRSRPG